MEKIDIVNIKPLVTNDIFKIVQDEVNNLFLKSYKDNKINLNGLFVERYFCNKTKSLKDILGNDYSILISLINTIFDEKSLDNYKSDILRMGLKMGIKKRNRRMLPNDLQCKGRKLDGEQCTRSRRNGSEYCLSHQKSLPHGRIDDNNYVKKIKGKRGRKKKSIENDYISTHIEEINGTEYLVDDYDNVFTYDLNNSQFLGKKHNLHTNIDNMSPNTDLLVNV